MAKSTDPRYQARPTVPQPVRQRVPKKIREAIDALATGRAQTKKEAAEKFGHISREYLARSFQKSAVIQYAKEAAARAVAMGAMRAAAVLNELSDCASQRVRLEAAKVSLQAAGIVGSGQNVNVNVGVELKAGYVIDLSGRNPLEPPIRVLNHEAGAVIDAKKPAEPIRGIGPGATADAKPADQDSG
jgi:hypothetical protein